MATQIDELAAKSAANTDAAAQAIAGFTSQLNATYEEIRKSAQEAGEAKAAAVTAEGLAKQKAQQATLQQATALGTNPDAANFALNQIAEEYKANNQRAQKFADNVAYAMDPANLFDNPLKYVGQLLLTEFNQMGQQSAERAASRSREQYVGLNNMTQEYAQTQAAISQTVTTDTIAATAKVAAFDYLRQAQAAEVEQIRTNSEQVMKALQLQNAPFEIERARQASANDAERLAIARQSAARQDVLASMQIQREKLSMKKLQEAEDANQQQLDILNNAAKLRGVPLYFATQKDLALAYKSPELKGKIDSLFEAGLTDVYFKAQDPSGKGIISIGARPSSTLSMVREVGVKTAPGQAPVLALIDGVNRELSSNPAAPKKRAEYDAALDSGVLDAAKKMYANVESAQGRNIYAPPPLQTYLADPNFVQGAPFLATQVFKTDGDLGAKTVNFGAAVEQVLGGVQNGKLTLNQADAELKFLAAKTMATNNALRQYDTTAGLPRMTNLNVLVDSGTLAGRLFPGGQEPLDLADDNKRGAFLAKRAASWIKPILVQQATKTMQGQK